MRLWRIYMIDSIELAGDYLLIPKIRPPKWFVEYRKDRIRVRLGISPNQLVTVAYEKQHEVPINRPMAHYNR